MRKLFGNLEAPITTEAAQNFHELSAIETAISKAVQPPPPSDPVDVSDILATIQGVADIAGLGELIDTTNEVVKIAANTGSVLSALLGVSAGATALGTNGDGGAAAEDNVETTAGKLEATIAVAQTQVVSTLNNVENATVLDSGRLQAMDQLAINTDVTGGTMNVVNDDYTLALKREFTSALVTTNWTFSEDFGLPVKPPTWITSPGEPNQIGKPSPITDMRQFYCEENFVDNIHPFNQMTPSTEYAPVTTFSPQGAPLQTIFFIVAARLDPGRQIENNSDQCLRHWPVHDFASGPVFNALFGPLGMTQQVNGNTLDDVAFIPAQWWWRNFSGQCWKIHTDVTGSLCAPNPNNYTATTAAAWTHQSSGS